MSLIENIAILVLMGLIGANVLFSVDSGFIADQNYTMSSNKSSPNGKYVITEYASTSDGGHGPYG